MSILVAALSGTMGQQGKTIVVGLMVAAMALGGVGTMFGGRQAEPGRPGGLGPDPELPDLLPVADEAMTSAFGTELAAQLAMPRPTMDFDDAVAREQVAARRLPDTADLAFRVGFLQGVSNNRGRVPHIVEQIHDLAHARHDLSYRGTTVRDGHPVARFRLIAIEGGVDFYDLLVGVKNDAPVIIDFFSLGSGQWGSELFAEAFSLAVAEGNGNEDDGMVAHAADLTALGDAHRAGRYEEVLRLYDALPEATQRLRMVTARRLEAASLTDNIERYLDILDENATQFPDDPSAHIRLLDAHILRQQWAEASTDVDALNESFPDAYWNSSRAAIALERGEPAAALTFAERLTEEDPALMDGPELGLEAALALGDEERADRFARNLRSEFGVDLSALVTVPGYEGVAELPAFAEAPATDEAAPSAP